jgi:YbbR domain-containing protein
MDKLLKSPWFVKIISFMLALMLYTVVAIDQNDGSAGIFPEVDESEQTYHEVEIQEKYDEENYVLSGLPDKVNVRFEGSKAALNRFKLQRSPEIIVDLTDYNEGDYNIRLELNNLPEDIKAYFPNNTVKVTLHQKVTKTFPVQIELMNTEKLPRGYVAGTPDFRANEVSITGAKEVIDTIAYVKGFVDISGAKDTISRDVELKAYKENMSEVQISVVPNILRVSIPIVNPSKEVALVIETTGELADDLELKSVTTETETVIVFGPQEVLDKLNNINVEVDLATVTEDKEINIKIKKPEGTFEINTTEITVTIDVEKVEEASEENEEEDLESTTFKSIPISIDGLSENFQATFISPKDGLFNLVVKGNKGDLENLKKDEIKALVDLQSLTEGRHTVKIEVSGPEKFLYQQSAVEAQLSIEENTTRS